MKEIIKKLEEGKERLRDELNLKIVVTNNAIEKIDSAIEILKGSKKVSTTKKVDHRKYPNHVRKKAKKEGPKRYPNRLTRRKRGSDKRIFSDEIDKFIEKNWKENTDANLRILIGNTFNKFYTREQIKAHRNYLNLVSGTVGRKKGFTLKSKPIKSEPSESGDDESIDGMDLDN